MSSYISVVDIFTIFFTISTDGDNVHLRQMSHISLWCPRENISFSFMSDFNLRLSFGAYFLTRPIHTPTYAHFWFYDQSGLYVAITTITLQTRTTRVSMRYPARWITCPISPRAIGKSFAVSSTTLTFSRSRSAGQFQRVRRHYEDVDRGCEYFSYGIRAQVVPAIYIRLSVMVYTKVTKVTRFLSRCKAEGGRRYIATQ